MSKDPFADFTDDILPDIDPATAATNLGLKTNTHTVSVQAPTLPNDTADNVPDVLINYNEKFANAPDVLYRDDVITQLCEILIRRKKSNALLVGPAGVGKTAIVEQLAKLIATNNPSVPQSLHGFTVYELPFSALSAGNSLVGQIEQVVEQIISFATNNDVIIFIDEIHQFFSNDSISQKIAQQFKPALARGDVKIIGATTSQESRDLYKDPAFKRRFSDCLVHELSIDQTIGIIKALAPVEQAHFDDEIIIDESIADVVVHCANKFLTTNHRPDNAITLLDQAAARLVMSTAHARATMPGHKPALLPVNVEATAKALTFGNARSNGIDFTALREDLSHIFGQDKILDRVVEHIQYRELALIPDSRPESWMFAGPSGVGKTEIARIVGKHITGTKPIIINGAEYMEPASVSKLLGSSAGYIGFDDKTEKPFDALFSNPRQVIVIDEAEKMHADVRNVFLSALDSGTIRMANSQEINISQSYIIFTTNAARDELSKNVSMGFGGANCHNELIDNSTQAGRDRISHALGKYFVPELLGRFTWIAVFAPLSEKIFAQIVKDKYHMLATEVVQNNPHYAAYVDDTISDEDVAAITRAAYTPAEGARPARKEIMNLLNRMVYDGINTDLTPCDTDTDTASATTNVELIDAVSHIAKS